MIDGQMFDTLEALARGIRGNQDPFGGIQLILSGVSWADSSRHHNTYYFYSYIIYVNI